MSKILPVNLSDLLNARTVESGRIEFKATWNPENTGHQVIRTICAFANDYHRLNGGYVVIGVAEHQGRAVLPPVGLSSEQVEEAQKWISGRCNRIRPAYQPVLSPEVVDGRHVLVVWAPGSDVGGHRAPAGAKGSAWGYWIRLGSDTVDAETRGLLNALLEQASRAPFDDRLARDASIEDIRESKVREHLKEAGSGLLDERDAHKIFRRMRIVGAANGYVVPRNVGLLLFSDDPGEWFRGARIEVARFADDRGGDVQDERVFRGGLAEQLRAAMLHLNNMSGTLIKKSAMHLQASSWDRFPADAVREALVNAVCHRSYREDAPDPVKVNIFPDRMVIASYPGPVPGIRPEHFVANARVPEVTPRNRRIAEFLKELRLAELRLSGIPKIFRAMKANGSPPPEFEFDEGRTYFQVTLPAHPVHASVEALRDIAELRAIGQTDEAERRLEMAWAANTRSAALATEMVHLHAGRGSFSDAAAVLDVFAAADNSPETARVANALAGELLRDRRSAEAGEVLTRFAEVTSGREAIEAAILARRVDLSEVARQYFERAGSILLDDPRALLECCQNKLDLAREAYRAGRRDRNRQLLDEAELLLRRVIRMDAPPIRHAWAWRELARTLEWLGRPRDEVEAAYGSAIKLAPRENRFRDWLDSYRQRARA